MNVRRPRPATSRPQATPAALSLRSSTAGWYAEWKARKTAAPSPAVEPQANQVDDGANAIAKWLRGEA